MLKLNITLKSVDREGLIIGLLDIANDIVSGQDNACGFTDKKYNNKFAEMKWDLGETTKSESILADDS